MKNTHTFHKFITHRATIKKHFYACALSKTGRYQNRANWDKELKEKTDVFCKYTLVVYII